MYIPTNPPTMRQFFQKVIAHHIDKNLTEVAKLQLEKMDWRNERSKEYHRRKWEYHNRMLMVDVCHYLAKFPYEVYARDVARHFGISVQKAAALLRKLYLEDDLVNIHSHYPSCNTYKLRKGISFVNID